MLPVLIFFGLIAVLVSIAYISIKLDPTSGQIYLTRCIKCDIHTTHKFYDNYICEKCLRKELRNNDG